jgi:excinuclease ABC subunit C
MIGAVNLKSKARDLPNKPGVYLMRDQLGRVIYVGKARSLRKRVGQYFHGARSAIHPSRRYVWDPKTRALIESIADFETFVVKSEPEALLLEGKLIKDYRPRYNAMFKDDKRFLLVKVNLTEPYPRFKFARLKKEDGARYFGPFAHGGSVRLAMQWIRKKYGVLVQGTGVPTGSTSSPLKEKDMKYSTYLVPVPLKDLSREEYLRRVNLACDFLEGRNKEAISQLEREMQQASREMQFEKAAQLRDVINSLREIGRVARERKFVRDFQPKIEPQSEMEELRRVLNLPTLPQHIEGFDISNISGTLSVASAVCFRDGKPHKQHYRHYRIKTVEGSDDFASMAEVVGRRYAPARRSAFSKPASMNKGRCGAPREGARVRAEGGALPDLVMVDGGAGQLAAALRALDALELRAVPAIGLAKRQEEIYLPSQPKPLRLDRTSPALHLIQRLRDEAHRFANAYHQKLRKQRIQESVLDEFPGLGEKRKQALLRHFGSIQRLRRSDTAEIAAVRGIGLKMASALEVFLARS